MPGVKSIKEYFVRKYKCHIYFEPSDCHPDDTVNMPASMQDLMSFLIYPHQQIQKTPPLSTKPLPFVDNIVDEVPHISHRFSGTYFDPEDVPLQLKQRSRFA